MVKFFISTWIISVALLISIIPLGPYHQISNTRTDADVVQINDDDGATTFGESDNDHETNEKGIVLTRHRPEPREMEELKSVIGVWQPENDYNPVIDGHGTGLRPPGEEEWAELDNKVNIVDDVRSLVRGPEGASEDHSSSKYFPPIGNQNGEGSCVAWAVGYYTKTFQEAKENDWDLSGASWVGGYKGNPTAAYQDRIMSPDFIYHQINGGEDTGSYYSSAMDVCYRIGACTWDKMPYNPDDSTTWPSEDAWRQAPWYRTDQGWNYMWTRPDNNPDGVEDLKTWLDGDNLAIISIRANEYSNLDGNDLWKNDTYSDAAGTNHANTIIGYDDDFGPYTENGQSRRGAFKIANSWGTGWGGDSNSDGMFWISYECMKWDVEYAMFFDDRIGYEPELVSVFEMSHTKRGECDVQFGIGDPSSPKYVKEFDDWFNDYDGGDHPYPSNKMVVDITEFMDTVPEINGSQLFIKVNDTETATVGTIDSFAVEYYSNYKSSNLFIVANSTDPVVNTVQGSTVNASLLLVDNTPPVPDAGSDQTVEKGTNVNFNGSGSTDNSAVDNYTWNFTYDGGGESLYGDTPDFTFNIYGSYEVTLNVTDPSGNWATDVMNLSVEDLTNPTADAGLSQSVDQGDTVTFDGSGSNDNTGIDNYTWNFTYDGMENIVWRFP